MMRPSQTSHCSFCMGKQITMLGTGPSPATSVWGQSKKVVLCQTKQTKIKRIKQLDKVGKHKKENFLHVASTFAYCFQCVLFAEIESFTSPNWQQISKAPSMKQESYYWERLLMMWCTQWIHKVKLVVTLEYKFHRGGIYPQVKSFLSLFTLQRTGVEI